MFTPKELEELSKVFDNRMKDLENSIMYDISMRIKANSKITRAANWEIYRLGELGKSKEFITNSIKSYCDISEEEIESLYSDVVKKGFANDEEIYKKIGKSAVSLNNNSVLHQLISAMAVQTSKEMTNLSQSLGFAIKMGDKITFTPLATYYQKSLDNAVNGVVTGAFDYNTAIKRAISEMTNSGLRSVDYASGHSNRIDVAARRAVMTGFNQIAAKINEQNAEKLGTETFEITYHIGARPTHQIWQGRWYKKSELHSVCGLGDVQGLCGANCYHNYYPVIPGVSQPTYTEEELEEMNRQENTPVPYNGSQYTAYEASQRQRKLETTMRAERQKIKLLQDSGADEETIMLAKCRYRATSQEYTAFSKAMNLPEQRQRVTVDGLGNISKGKYTKIVAKSNNRGIISLNDSSSIYKPVTKQSISNVPRLEVFTTENPKFAQQVKILNDRYQEANRNLLKEVMKQPIGTEVSIVYDMNMQPIKGCSYIVGKVGSVKIDDPNIPYHAFHNHGSGETFSVQDLMSFAKRKNMLSLTVMGNNGNIFSFTSTNSSNKYDYEKFLIMKSEEVIYKANGIDFTYNFLYDKNRRKEVVEALSNLTQKQMAELKNKIIALSEECAIGGKQYGFKYKYKKT